MKASTCYFSLASGLIGCYMPDSYLGAYAVNRRKDLIEAIRDTLVMLDAPKSAMRQVNWTRLWSQAKHRGVSGLSFSIETSKGYGLSFFGMTEAEYNEYQMENNQ